MLMIGYFLTFAMHVKKQSTGAVHLQSPTSLAWAGFTFSQCHAGFLLVLQSPPTVSGHVDRIIGIYCTEVGPQGELAPVESWLAYRVPPPMSFTDFKTYHWLMIRLAPLYELWFSLSPPLKVVGTWMDIL